MWLILLIIIIVVVVSLTKKGGTTSPDDAMLLFSYYETIRNKYQDCSNRSIIVVGSPIVKYNGTNILSGFLAVYVSEDDASGTAKAKSLGMQTKERDGKFEHQFVIRKKYSKQVKRQLLQAVGSKIQEVYPNDLLKYDESLPMIASMVDKKDVIEAIMSIKR